LLPVAITAILLFRYINTEGTSNKSLSLAFYVALLILLLPIVPRYLISSSALGWAALSILLLYGASVLEIARRMYFTINTKSSDASFST